MPAVGPVVMDTEDGFSADSGSLGIFSRNTDLNTTYGMGPSFRRVALPL